MPVGTLSQPSWFDLSDQHRRAKKDAEFYRRYGPTEQSRDTGIELVYRHSDTTWQQAAKQRLQHVIRTHETFTSDDVIEWLDQQGIVTSDNRAIAAILKGAEKAGQITATDNWVPTRRARAHCRPVRVWRVVRAVR